MKAQTGQSVSLANGGNVTRSFTLHEIIASLKTSMADGSGFIAQAIVYRTILETVRGSCTGCLRDAKE